MTQSKRNAILLLGVVSVLILILAMSLPELVLSPAQPFAMGDGQVVVDGVLTPATDVNIFALFIRGLLGTVGVLFIIHIIYSLFSKEGRQRILFNIILVVIIFLLASYLQRLTPEEVEQPQTPPQAMVAPEDIAAADVPEAVFSPDPPNWITPAVIVLVSALTVGLLFGARRFFIRPDEPASPLEEFAQEAEQAIESLNTGQDFKLTVINCYQEMTRIVKELKGIERNSTMTVREFEDYLIRAGLPEEAIQMLSRLFERVRYGGALEQSQDEELALACLTDIVDACRNIGVRNGI